MNWLEELAVKNPNPPAVRLPRRFADVTIAGILQPRIQSTTREYLEQFWTAGANGIAPLYIGASGQYKTYAAAVVAKTVGLRIETRFVSCPLLFAQSSLDKIEAQRTLREVSAVPFVVLDDFATVDPKHFGFQLLLAVATERHNQKLPTMWTGNLVIDRKDPFKSVVDRYGPLFARRLDEGSTGFRVATL